MERNSFFSALHHGMTVMHAECCIYYPWSTCRPICPDT